MTDLDRQIAEIKGWRHVPAGTEKVWRGAPVSLGEGWMEPTPKGEWYHAAFNCDWSGSDFKALELVDELLATFPGRMDLSITYACSGAAWHCDINVDAMTEVEVWGKTRPEAICRAYIAAVTWMRGRGLSPKG